MTCGPGAHVAREQALQGCLAAGREKEGELVTTPRCQSAPESLLAGFVRKCQALCFPAVLFSGLKRVL